MTAFAPGAGTPGQIDGMDQAAEHTEGDWAADCQKAIRVAADLGLPFQAADLVAARLVGEPAHPNHWGPQFAAAHRAGLIQPAGAAKSKRPSTRNSLCLLWVGTGKTERPSQ